MFRLFCATGIGKARTYEVDSPRTGLIMMDAICNVWRKEDIKIKHKLSAENLEVVTKAVMNEKSLMPSENGLIFPIIDLQIFINGEWEEWFDGEGNDIKEYEVEDFDCLNELKKSK